ncbi:hypothetical protein NEF87_003468 [Candidatus Lokiarchaeum ossiferum]|uniref:Vitamin B12 dependent methionine synthase n=1 Tax=Candidatus Lokiarchaeum ossiferum TaxID=2951803 RepID=A0ABY6HUI6_9ARCH|nr:hypothetical protein NEF87_003468 [Candidatus Lokiarchaeum sp. B-35]
MPIERNFNLTLNQEELLKILGNNFSQLLKKPKFSQIFCEIQSNLFQLFEPQLIWDLFPVKDLTPTGFLLESGVKIGGGPVKEVMGEASKVLLGICTIGPKFDEEINKFTQSGNIFEAVILESIASFLVDQVRETFFSQTQLKIKREGKFNSILLCPGESDWDVSDHKFFFDLLHPEQIGVSLKESMLMIPMKSLSFMIGVRNEPFRLDHKRRCDFCSLQPRCRYSQINNGRNLCT